MTENTENKNQDIFKYPGTENVTFKWLHDNIPMLVWISFFGLLGIAFTFGLGIGAKPFIEKWLDNNSNTVIQTDKTSSIMKSKVESLNIQINEKDLQANKYIEQINIQEASINSLESTNKILINQFDKLSLEFNKISKKNSLSEETINKLQEKVQEQKSQININENKTAKSTKALNDQIANLKKDSMDLTYKVNKSESENTKLVRELEVLKKQKKISKPANNKIESGLTSSQVIASLSNMSSTYTSDYLKKIIPKVNGGVPCEDLATMLSRVSATYRDSVVINVADYVQKPISEKCIKSISNLIPSTYVDDAMEALLNPK